MRVMPIDNERWLVAAWPGLGQVAATSAVYLLAKLAMHQVAEFNARDLFELEQVEVHGGILRAARLPRSRLFLWRNPRPGRDIVVFLGEAQPPTGKLALCARLLNAARGLGVRRVFTFAASVTDMHPNAPSRVFGVASDALSLDELRRHEVAIHREGRIGGLNGVLLAAAAEAGLPATGLLGEMPALAAQLPYASASAAVLRVFNRLAGIELDLSDIEEYGQSVQRELARLYDQVQRALSEQAQAGGAPSQPESAPAQTSAETLPDEDALRIERLFADAKRDRAKAFELKKELDRLGRFRQYEDRFLDLFEHGP